MIDNPEQVTALMQKLKMHLPIPVKATDALISTMRTSSINLSPQTGIEITDVIYMGDEGGICCTLKVMDQKKIVLVVVSLTHLRLLNTDPLSSDVRAYQISRTKKLARSK
jgi:hypothetical protein